MQILNTVWESAAVTMKARVLHHAYYAFEVQM